MTTVIVDMRSSASEAIIPCGGIGAQDLSKAPEGDAKTLRKDIIAVSEGVHNGITFGADEIKNMVSLSDEMKVKEKRTNYAVPLVLDHSDRFLDKIGATNRLNFGTAKGRDGNDIPAALAGVEIWRDLAAGEELAKRIERDPENTFFSVRVRGELSERGKALHISNLQLIHIAVVQEPADGNARILSQESEKQENSDFSLSQEKEEIENMTELEDKIASLKAENADLSAKMATLMTQVANLTKEKADLSAALEAQKAEIALAAEKSVKEGMIAELGADHGFSNEFLMGLSVEQITAFKADLASREGEKNGNAGPVPAAPVQKSMSKVPAVPVSLAKLANDIFGAVEKEE